MPLDRDHMTIASRVMLPTYAIVDALFAGVFLLDPQDRLSLAPSLVPARAVLPLEVWGGLWLVLAAVMIYALRRHQRATFVAALSTNAAAWFLWGLLIGSAVFTQPNVTPLAGVQSWFIAVASVASMLSLLWRETR